MYVVKLTNFTLPCRILANRTVFKNKPDRFAQGVVYDDIRVTYKLLYGFFASNSKWCLQPIALYFNYSAIWSTRSPMPSIAKGVSSVPIVMS